ncbi:hypothetical protein OK016_24610 [Vibrio chagasii]|nr:hypothetical protein [Vibrio chagasii]
MSAMSRSFNTKSLGENGARCKHYCSKQPRVGKGDFARSERLN